jgi:hypothetical protein
MLGAMEAVFCLRPGKTISAVGDVLRNHGVAAARMHPGVADASMAQWYLLSGGSDAEQAAAIATLQSHPAVDAALLKPAGEAPA